MIRVLLADDHGVIRDGLGRLISALDDVELVAVAADGAEAVAQCDRHAPDVVLMDLDMPVLDGIEATRLIATAHPQTAVLVLTSFSDGPRIMGALDAGACGYLLKDVDADAVAEGIRAAARGASRRSIRAPHAGCSTLAPRLIHSGGYRNGSATCSSRSSRGCQIS